MAWWKNNNIPEAPYYANIFILTRSGNQDGYQEMDEETLRLVKEMDGFLGYENVNNGNEGIFISYWQTMESIDTWRKNMTHIHAKDKGRALWYDRYLTQICRIESSHEMKKK
jgi:heme-degrading monooxygenase HmoA